MRELSRWLQTNSIIVVVMFLVSLASGVIGLLLGWKQFYQDYLSKSVELPVWLLLLTVLLLPGVVALYRRLGRSTPDGPFDQVAGKKFGVQQVFADGKAFYRCEFHGTEVLFSGERCFALEHCLLKGIRFTFSGAAANTLVVLTKLYADPGLRSIAEEILANVRAGSHPESPPPVATK